MKRLTIFLIILTFVCSFSVMAIGQEGYGWVDPASQQASVSSQAVVTIGANSGTTEVFTVDIELTFDDTRLSITESDISILVSGWTFENSVTANKITLKGFNFVTPISGNTNIATLTFTTISEGMASLTLDKVLLQNNAGLITMLEGGQVDVQAAPTFSCTGNNPQWATLCSGSDQNLGQNYAKTVADSCTGTNCQFSCNQGYHKDGTSCIQDQQQQATEVDSVLAAISQILNGESPTLEKLAAVAAQLFSFFSS